MANPALPDLTCESAVANLRGAPRWRQIHAVALALHEHYKIRSSERSTVLAEGWREV
jgi:hypothetical protein